MVDSGQRLQTFSGHLSGVWAIAFAPQGDYLVSSSIDQTVRLWDISTGECQQILHGHSNWVMSVDVSPDGQQIASGSRAYGQTLGRPNRLLCEHPKRSPQQRLVGGV
ncbi:MAG: WD40 repeat domain-containing protein [Leptolyngbyaceae cyanobacterium]